MGDGDLRDLERRAAAGDVDAEARLFSARRRLGALRDEQLHLAAYVGHAGALLALRAERPLCECVASGTVHERSCPLAGRTSADTPDAVRIPPTLWKWLRHLPAQHDGLLIAGEAVWSVSRRHAADAPTLVAAIDALLARAREWRACPCADHVAQVDAARVDRLEHLSRDGPSWWVGGIAEWIPDLVSSPDPGRARTPLADHVTKLVQEGVDEGALRRAIRDAVSGWALTLPPSAPEEDDGALVRTGAQVRLLRDRLMLIQRELAAALGVSATSLARMEREDEPLPPDVRRRLHAWLERRGSLARAREALGRRRHRR